MTAPYIPISPNPSWHVCFIWLMDNGVMASLPIPRITEEEYLRLDRAAETKSEFVDGEIFAMSGGSFPHSILAVKWMGELLSKLRGRNCVVFNSDERVRTPGSGSYVYPDVSVVCGKPQSHRASDDILTNPVVVIEVLSPSTEDYDRGKKFALYREIASLQDYLLVHSDEVHVESFTRQPEGWLLREYRGAEAAVPIASIDCAVLLGDVYAGVIDAEPAASDTSS
jgi:Uma2 family endonuclease